MVVSFCPSRLESGVYPDQIDIETQGRRTTFRLRGDLTRDGAPVYEIDGSGVEARPNGSVWIRFAEGTDAASRAADIAAAGYRIERVPGYAANAAFVTAD